MPDKESHTIRNSIIATVVGGLILSIIISPSRKIILRLLVLIWSGVTWTWTALISYYSMPGWLVISIDILAFLGILNLYRVLTPRKEKDPKFKKYTEDFLYGAKWRWSWDADNYLSNLWCFCPRCDAQLVYDDSSCRNIMSQDKTTFFCENCQRVVASVDGGNKNYALAAAEREILRRIRTNEYLRSNPTTPNDDREFIL